MIVSEIIFLLYMMTRESEYISDPWNVKMVFFPFASILLSPSRFHVFQKVYSTPNSWCNVYLEVIQLFGSKYVTIPSHFKMADILVAKAFVKYWCNAKVIANMLQNSITLHLLIICYVSIVPLIKAYLWIGNNIHS